MHTGPVVLNLGLAYARLAWPTNPSMTIKMPTLNSPTLLFMYIYGNSEFRKLG